MNEAEHGGFHSRVVQISHRYGMILFIASEVMFFVAWFWAYFSTALFPNDIHQVMRADFLGHEWPPGSKPLIRGICRCSNVDPPDLRHDGHLGAPRAAA